MTPKWRRLEERIDKFVEMVRPPERPSEATWYESQDAHGRVTRHLYRPITCEEWAAKVGAVRVEG